MIVSRVLTARALAEVSVGRSDAAVRTVRRLDAVSPEPFNDVAADLAYVLARAAAALGDPDLMTQARRRIGEIARVASGPNVMAAAKAMRGYAALAGGRTADASGRFQAGAALYARASRPVLAGELWCEAALASGPGRAATAALQRAQLTCDAHGLGRVAARIAAVREELSSRPFGVAGGLAELTPRERDVALLAAEGLSNREVGLRLYLSEGTVRNYLSTAFDKLGVSRRAELARLVAAAGLEAAT